MIDVSVCEFVYTIFVRMTSFSAWLHLDPVLSGVPIKVLTTFNKLRALTKRSDVICSAMMKGRNGLVEVCVTVVEHHLYYNWFSFYL